MLPRLFFFNIYGEHDDVCLSLYVFDLPRDRSEPDADRPDRSLGL